MTFKQTHRKYDKSTPTAVAEAIREATYYEPQRTVHKPELITLLCDYFEHDRTDFNRQAFIEACGE